MPTESAKSEVESGSEFSEELLGRLNSFNAAPILFVGSGISRRYLGLPNWDELLVQLAGIVGKDIAFYRSSADGNKPHMATLMSDDMRDLLWEDEHAELREKYKGDITRQDSALKIFASALIRKFTILKGPDLVAELRLLRKVEVDAIITTNYDRLLERLFPDYKTFVGQDELLLSDPQGVGEIYKLHGSVEKPNSLVITSKDYNDYNKRNAYLAAKLMTFFAEHPVIFIGYSLGDEDVISTINSLVECIRPENISVLQDRLFVVKWQEHATAEISSTVITALGKPIPVISIVVPDFIELFRVLGQVERKFPAQLLRRLKKRVYDLVLSKNSQGMLHVADMDEEDASKVDVVFGVGAIHSFGHQGYIGLTRLNLCLDVLSDNLQLNPEIVVQKAVPNILSQPGYCPIVKYLVNSGHVADDGSLIDEEGLDPKVAQRYREGPDLVRPNESQKKKAKKLALQADNSFTKLVAQNSVEDVFMALGALPLNTIDPDELQKFLVDQQANCVKDGKPHTYWAKAVCIYDRVKYLANP